MKIYELLEVLQGALQSGTIAGKSETNILAVTFRREDEQTLSVKFELEDEPEILVN